MSQNLPLSGLNVLEQCGWNGILTGRLLAEAGAKVIRAYPENQDPLEKKLLFLETLLLQFQGPGSTQVNNYFHYLKEIKEKKSS